MDPSELSLHCSKAAQFHGYFWSYLKQLRNFITTGRGKKHHNLLIMDLCFMLNRGLITHPCVQGLLQQK